MDPFAQTDYRCRLEWGRRGARIAAERGDILVIVDVLSFSTSVATAVHFGGILYPCSYDEDPKILAESVNGVMAVARQEVPAKGCYSLSPCTYRKLEAGTRIVLQSPNGATCSRYGTEVPALFVGALVNAQATARAVMAELQEREAVITVVACGERWQTSSEDGDLRFAMEDYLGAGAILASLNTALSPEAELCAAAFLRSRENLERLLHSCGSGRELHTKGYAADVAHAAQLDIYPTAARMVGRRLEAQRA